MILIAAHKNFDFYHLEREIYKKIEVGAFQDKDLIDFDFTDDSGDNISTKNASYCEMTAIYWAWKNLDSEHIGLCHYRRYFTSNGTSPLSGEELEHILENYDAILPVKRNYYIDSVWTHYKHSHHIKDLELAREIISDLHPEYLSSFDEVVSSKSLSLYNMFVYDRPTFEQYCRWVFSILAEMEKRVDISNYSDYQKRVFGFVAERLHNVFVAKNLKNKKIKYLSTLEPEAASYLSKAFGLISRKFNLEQKK